MTFCCVTEKLSVNAHFIFMFRLFEVYLGPASIDVFGHFPFGDLIPTFICAPQPFPGGGLFSSFPCSGNISLHLCWLPGESTQAITQKSLFPLSCSRSLAKLEVFSACYFPLVVSDPFLLPAFF